MLIINIIYFVCFYGGHRYTLGKPNYEGKKKGHSPPVSGKQQSCRARRRALTRVCSRKLIESVADVSDWYSCQTADSSAAGEATAKGKKGRKVLHFGQSSSCERKSCMVWFSFIARHAISLCHVFIFSERDRIVLLLQNIKNLEVTYSVCVLNPKRVDVNTKANRHQ